MRCGSDLCGCGVRLTFARCGRLHLALDDAPWVPRNEHGRFARVYGAWRVIATCRRVQLLRNESDEKPVLIDTGMRITNIRWNNSGEPVQKPGWPPLPQCDDERCSRRRDAAGRLMAAAACSDVCATCNGVAAHGTIAIPAHARGAAVGHRRLLGAGDRWHAEVSDAVGRAA